MIIIVLDGSCLPKTAVRQAIMMREGGVRWGGGGEESGEKRSAAVSKGRQTRSAVIVLMPHVRLQ